MNDSVVSFNEEEYEALANFSRLAGFVNVKSAVLALFALRRKRDTSQAWRYCPSCGAEYTLLGSDEDSGNRLLHLVRGEKSKVKIWLNGRFLLGANLYTETGSLLGIYQKETDRVKALTGTEESLAWLLYYSELPYELRGSNRALTRTGDGLYTIMSNARFRGVLLKTRREEEAAEYLKNGLAE